MRRALQPLRVLAAAQQRSIYSELTRLTSVTSNLYTEVRTVSARPFEYLQHPVTPVTLDRIDPKLEASLEPLADFMSKLVDLFEERGPEWSKQSPPQRVENILRALRQL